MPALVSHGLRRGAKSPNPTPPEAHSDHHVDSERSTHTLTNPTHPRKSPPPRCELRETETPTCVGRPEAILVDRNGAEQRLCPAHAAALWLTDPTLRFSAKTRPEAIATVMAQAFGGGR
ncbi:hypothetical protein GCM10018793_00130 [Streptomyces sulfonofaciens]|uniref:Uncharacterized protein n=1 Tax=Streptomyces sulfonofaciens TaxID=68272 RepID=A0A919FNM0_9ACTN|nr:hypothetical protein GCM10018793_00130 [Streptomyces sulfonofaciens]